MQEKVEQRYREWLERVETAGERAELEGLDAAEKQERFARALSFGTAGMRGVVALGPNRMNAYTVRRATLGLARCLSARPGDKEKGVVISYDVRRCSRLFAIAAAEVLAAASVTVYLFADVRPVPMCSFAVRHLGAAAGVMITASHNPKEYNGYKVYGADGAQMAEDDTARVVEGIEQSGYFGIPHVCLDEKELVDGNTLQDRVHVIGHEVDEAYYRAVLSLSLMPHAAPGGEGGDAKVVYTPVHGTGYVPVTQVFARLGIHPALVEQQIMPDTEFSTVRVPNPENPETLKLAIELGKARGASVVLGTDPDCDRMGVAVRNEQGEFVPLSGNQIGVLLLDYVLARKQEAGCLPANGAVVKTIVTTTLADRLAADYGVSVFNVLTGFKYIGEKIKEWEGSGAHTFLFGFEESYGSLCGTHARDKDAVVACMLFAEMTTYYEQRGSSVWRRLMQIFARYGTYVEKNVAMTYPGLDGMERMAAIMKGLRARTVSSLGGLPVLRTDDYLTRLSRSADGQTRPLTLPSSDVVYFALPQQQFVCVRPSGTEPKLKVYVLVFDQNEDLGREKAERVWKTVQEELQ